MLVVMLRSFARWLRSEQLDGAVINDLVERLERGLIDADLGGGLVKQRIARPGQGRSGGFRTILAYRSGDRIVLFFGYAKSRRANLSKHELQTYRLLAASYLALSLDGLRKAVRTGELIEVPYDGSSLSE